MKTIQRRYFFNKKKGVSKFNRYRSSKGIQMEHPFLWKLSLTGTIIIKQKNVPSNSHPTNNTLVQVPTKMYRSKS